MTPAQVLPVAPGDRVLDLCAAPGGKATALAAKLAGKGMLVANDISASRAKALLKNLELFGVANSFVTNEIPAKLAVQYPEFFDKILVDAPCSGEGMFRKDIANARAWSMAKVRDCAKTQKEIALQAVSMLRPGGMMLYSTCTFSPEEDEQVIAYILENCPDMELLPIPMAEGFEMGRPELADEDWMNRKYDKTEGQGRIRDRGMKQIRTELTKCVRIFPHKMPGEGHFMALLGKSQAGEGRRESVYAKTSREEKDLFSGVVREKERGNKKNKKDRSRLRTGSQRGTVLKQKMAERVGTEFVAAFLEEQNLTEYLGSLDLRGDRVFYVPECMKASEETGGVRFLRNGLYLGEIKKDRFEPSQAFAMAIRPEKSAAILNFGFRDERVMRYLRGETLDVEDLLAEGQFGGICEVSKEKDFASGGQERLFSGVPNGWRLVCVNGFPLGWGRLTGSMLKNKYHPGWRIQ